MIHIAVIEDEKSCSEQLESVLECWGTNHNITLNIYCFDNGKKFLSCDYNCYNLIFLDIDMPEISGMETAKILRQNGYTGYIVFVTSHNEYVFEGYHVRALDYILKPITSQILEDCLTPFLQELRSSTYVLRTATSIEKISYSFIIAFITQGHYVEIITTQTIYKQRISLKTLKEQLPKNFVQCHRTVIVNINNVVKIDNKNLYLINHTIYPVSKKYIEAVQNAFINCIT